MPKCIHLGRVLFVGTCALQRVGSSLWEHPISETPLKMPRIFSIICPWKQRISPIPDSLPRAQGRWYHSSGCSEMFTDHAEITAVRTQESFQNQVITEKCWPNLKHLQPELPMAQLQISTGTFQCLWASAAKGKFTEIHRPIPSAFRDSSRAQQQWHRLISKDHRDDVWMQQPSLSKYPRHTLCFSKKRPSKASPRTEVKRASTRASTHTHRYTLPGMRTAFTSGL